MNKEEMFAMMNANPAFHLATVEGNQPRVRGMFLYRADENGIVFHTGTFKDVYRQIEANPRVELCFNDLQRNVQIRASGTLEQVTDTSFKEEICAHPTRAFLKPMRESMPLEKFHQVFTVSRLRNGSAVSWSFETNLAPKQPVAL